MFGRAAQLPVTELSKVQAQECLPAASRALFPLIPLISVQVKAALGVDGQALGPEAAHLFPAAAPRRQGDCAPTVDHTMPGKPLFVRAGVKGSDHLSSGSGVAGQVGDLAVSGHSPAGDSPNQSDDLPDERV
jgi:hypothetical protein